MSMFYCPWQAEALNARNTRGRHRELLWKTRTGTRPSMHSSPLLSVVCRVVGMASLIFKVLFGLGRVTWFVDAWINGVRL